MTAVLGRVLLSHDLPTTQVPLMDTLPLVLEALAALGACKGCVDAVDEGVTVLQYLASAAANRVGTQLFPQRERSPPQKS